MKSLLPLLFIFGLTACGPVESTNTIEVTPPAPEAAVDEASQAKDTWVNPYPSYCFERVGQIGADGQQDEPRRGEVCDVHGGGAGSLERGSGSDPRNTVSVHIAAPSLRAIGMKSFSFSLNRKSADPKFITGVHVMDHYDTRDIGPGDVLPARLAGGSDLSGENSFFTHTSPDAANLRANAGGLDFTGYEITSAVLKIDTAIDVPIEEFEADMARKTNMVMGEQYVEGTLTISLIPIGSTGSQYGPTTFEFGTTIDWGYSKSLYKEK